jgi:hypothetical protein
MCSKNLVSHTHETGQARLASNCPNPSRYSSDQMRAMQERLKRIAESGSPYGTVRDIDRAGGRLSPGGWRHQILRYCRAACRYRRQGRQTQFVG